MRVDVGQVALTPVGADEDGGRQVGRQDNRHPAAHRNYSNSNKMWRRGKHAVSGRSVAAGILNRTL